jgi:hypothetical protein
VRKTNVLHASGEGTLIQGLQKKRVANSATRVSSATKSKVPVSVRLVQRASFRPKIARHAKIAAQGKSVASHPRNAQRAKPASTPTGSVTRLASFAMISEH